MKAIYRYFRGVVRRDLNAGLRCRSVVISQKIYDVSGVDLLRDEGIFPQVVCLDLKSYVKREDACEHQFLLCDHAELENVAKGYEQANVSNKTWPCTYVSLAGARKATVQSWMLAFPDSTRVSAFGTSFLQIDSEYLHQSLLRSQFCEVDELACGFEEEVQEVEAKRSDYQPVTLCLEQAPEGHYVLFAAHGETERIALGLITKLDIKRSDDLETHVVSILRNEFFPIAELLCSPPR